MMGNLRFALVSLAAVASLPSCQAFTGPGRQHQAFAQLRLSTDGADAEVMVHESSSSDGMASSRRSFIAASFASVFVVDVVRPSEAEAAADCFKDCLKNCKLIAPKDPGYCQNNCQDYCDQPDRTDGLSGSVSSTGGETGILGTNTVVKGEDKPPEVKIPGLDFTSDKGRKLLGY